MSAGRRGLRVRREHVYALGLGLLALSLGLGFYQPELAPWGDNAQFIVVAKSLASGQGLREINHPAKPTHKKYPAGFPLMLAAVERIRPDAVQAMKGMVLAQFVLSTVLIFWLLQLFVDRRLAAAVAILFCSSQLALQFASEVMSEVPFLCFSLIALLLGRLEEQAQSTSSRRWLLAGTIAASVWALLLRSIGAALIGALALRMVLRRRYLGAGLLVALGAAAFLLHSAMLGAGDNEYLAAYTLVDFYDAAKGQVTWGGLMDRALSNLAKYSLDLIPGSIVPLQGAKVLLWLFVVILATGFVRSLWRRESLALYFGGTLLLLLAWPRIWAIPRYLVPLLPIILLWLLQPLAELGAWARRRWPGLPAWTGTALAAAVVLAIAIPNLVEATRYDPQRDSRWRQYVRGLEWIRDRAPADAIVMCRKPYLGFLHSKRRTVPTVRSSDEGDFYRALDTNRVGYVVVDSMPLPGTREVVIPNIKRRRSRYELVYRAPSPPLWIFHYLGSGATSGGPVPR